MGNETLISLNFDKAPLISVGSQESIFGVHFKADGAFRDTGWHRHEVASIGCVESGMISIQTETDSVVVSSGMVVFTPADCAHIDTSMGSPMTGWVIVMPREQVRFMQNQFAVLKTSDLLLSIAKRIVSWGKIEQSQKTKAQKRLIQAFLDELAIAEKADSLFIPMPKKEVLRTVCAQIMSEPNDKNGLDYWARAAGMSRRSFTDHFRKETGIAFARWRQLVKLKEALSQLALGTKVNDVSFALGYESVSTFIAIFKKQFGSSPMEYMRRVWQK